MHCNAATSIGQCDELDGCAWTDSNTGVGGLCHVFTCPYPEPDEFALNPNIHPLSDCTQPVCRKDIFSGVTCNYESECHDPGGNWESCTAPTSCEEAIQRTECEGIDGCEWYDSPDFTVEKSRRIIKPPFTCPEQPAEPGFGCIPKNDGGPYCRQDRETKNQCVYDNSCLVPYHLWEACNPTTCAESENDAQCLTIPGCVLKDVYSSSLGFVTLCIEGP